MGAWMERLPEWITAIATVVTSASVFFLWRQIVDDHDRTRRDNAIKLTFEWAKQLHRSGSLARKLVETFTFEQALRLASQESLSVELSKKDMVIGCLSKPLSSVLTEDSTQVVLNVEHVSELRWQIISYLNTLEAILCSYRHGMADKSILEEQFRYLVSPEQGHYILREFRKAVGGAKSYPAIQNFVEVIEAEHKASPVRKPIA